MKCLALALALTACSTDTFVGADGSVGDSGTDDVKPGEGGGGDACASVPMACAANQVCSDFDGQQGLAPFVNASQNGGTATVVSDQFMTCPHAVAATAPQQTSSQAFGALGATSSIVNVLASQHARVELDAIFPTVLTGPAIFLLMYANGDTNHPISVAYDSQNWTVHDPVTGDQSQPFSPRLGAWNHVALDVVFSASGSLAKIAFEYVDVNGSKQTVTIGNKETAVNATITSVTFAAGVFPIGTTTAPMTMFIDDVVWTPF